MAEIFSINRIPADFVANTRHLSVEDRGAYQEILDQIVLLGQDEDPPSLPDDDHFIARLLGWPVRKWRNTKERLCAGTGAVLLHGNGRLSQARIVLEIENARERIRQAQKAGIASGEKRRKTATLRERMANGSSTHVQHEFNSRSTHVPTGVQQELNGSTNGSRTPSPTQREPAINHEPRTTNHEEESTAILPRDESQQRTEPSSLPANGLEAMELLQRTAAVMCPAMDMLDDFTVSGWIRDLNRDPYWLAAAIIDARTSGMASGDKIAKVRNPAYLTKVLQGHVTTGWTPGCEDVKEWVEFSLRTFDQRVARAIEITSGRTVPS